MMTWIREKFGTLIIGGIIGLLTLVFVFYGITTPKGSRGGATAGEVNGEPIELGEYNQALNRQIDFFKQMTGGQLTDEQMKAFRIRESVFQNLVRRKLMVQEAYKENMIASDEAVRQTIEDLPYFKKDGKFDLITYKQLLEQNQRTPGSFEREVREDLSTRSWQEYFERRVHVSDEEAKREFLVSQDKRNIKYVLLTSETGRRGVEVKPEEIKKFLTDGARLNLAKSQFEAKKDTLYKGKTFDAMKDEIAKDLIASEKTDQILKVNEKLAVEIKPLLKANKSSDTKLNALLKPYGAEVKTTGFITRENPYVPGIGQAKELMADSFSQKSPIDPSQGGQAKKYSQGAWVLVALVQESQKPDLSKFESGRSEIIRKLIMKKQKAMFDAWMSALVSRAKINGNPAVINSGDEG